MQHLIRTVALEGQGGVLSVCVGRHAGCLFISKYSDGGEAWNKTSQRVFIQKIRSPSSSTFLTCFTVSYMQLERKMEKHVCQLNHSIYISLKISWRPYTHKRTKKIRQPSHFYLHDTEQRMEIFYKFSDQCVFIKFLRYNKNLHKIFLRKLGKVIYIYLKFKCLVFSSISLISVIVDIAHIIILMNLLFKNFYLQRINAHGGRQQVKKI